MDEIERKLTMGGPYTYDEVTERHGPLWMPARRFALKQGTKEDDRGKTQIKWRLIDDYAENGVNDAANLTETIMPSGTDVTVANAKAWSEAFKDPSGKIHIELAGGESLSGTRHPSWDLLSDEDRQLTGFLVDLKAAYRQIPIRASERHIMIVAFWDPHSKQVMFAEHLGSPFGAAAVVNNFNHSANITWLDASPGPVRHVEVT